MKKGTAWNFISMRRTRVGRNLVMPSKLALLDHLITVLAIERKEKWNILVEFRRVIIDRMLKNERGFMGALLDMRNYSIFKWKIFYPGFLCDHL